MNSIGDVTYNTKREGVEISSFFVILYTEAVTRMCSVKKVFLKMSQNSQENTCVRISFLIKLQASGYRTPIEHLRL